MPHPPLDVREYVAPWKMNVESVFFFMACYVKGKEVMDYSMEAMEMNKRSAHDGRKTQSSTMLFLGWKIAH
ncbi:TMV resistance protein N-like [Sesbania bispinosa]|nr:TMV resistance protein N-like [Sesbania bispinosa]